MKKHIDIEGMSCGHCANAVKTVLEELGGKNVTVDHAAGYAEAEIDADDALIKEKIAEEDFEVTNITAM
ncbi:MAG: heavy-metal-associated domain-containing protein [Clostridium sp.]|nr:heavy-metal-associated domain-containing protein [Clostridium sp.]MCM1547885.1 heavy-metal-associated domain-containing protein [Ruminococcus sp.]